MRRPRVIFAALALTLVLAAAAQAPPAFAPLAGWAAAVRAGNATALQAMYAAAPPPQLIVSTGVISDVPREAAFWAGWKKTGLSRFQLQMISDRALGPDLHEVGFEAGIHYVSAAGPQSVYCFVQQTWRRTAKGWRIISGGRTDLSRLEQPTALTAPIYSKTANASADIAQALARARAGNKRVLLDFGGNWCYDCHVLDMAFRRSDLAPLLEANYELVNVDVEQFNYNLDIVKRYGLSIMQGVPMLAVLAGSGKLLASSQDGSFQDARALGPEDLIRFLVRWRPQ